MSNIIENAKSITIVPHAIQFPKLHGHMKLELTGCREKQVIEHDNMMTDALDKMFSFAGGIWGQSTKLLDALSPSVKTALGGIVLTDKTLEETALTVPGGTEVTACAAYGTVNGDSALTQGSYNQTESAWDSTNKKMTYVYDWATDKGNGTIAAAALTHVNMGKCGFGDAGLGQQSTKYDGSYLVSSITVPDGDECVLYADDTYIVTGKVSGNVLNLYRRYANITKLNPLFTNTFDSEYSAITKIEIQTDGLTTITPRCSHVSGENVYMINNTVVSPGGTLKLYKLSGITSDSPQIETINIVNNSEHYLQYNYGFEVYNGFIYIKGSKNYKNTLVEIEIANPANVNIYNNNFDNLYLNVKTIGNGKLYLFYNYGDEVVFDTVAKSFKCTKISIDYNYSQLSQGIVGFRQSTNGYKYIYKSVNLEYLATINNLESSVVKTADKTMKVTYTIQE